MSSETTSPRLSVGSLAVIRRAGSDGRPLYLAQWNPKWQAFYWIGGHQHDGESARACLVREIAEELGASPPEDDPDAPAAIIDGGDAAPRCRVDPEPVGVLEYEAFSRSADAPTKYALTLFVASLSPAAIARVSQESDNCWLTAEEIDAGVSAGGKAVSETMRRHLDWPRGLDLPPISR